LSLQYLFCHPQFGGWRELADENLFFRTLLGCFPHYLFSENSGRLLCTAKALWKLGWFLRDFTHDPELLGRDEVDEKPCRGLALYLAANC
jgi:hypothetical protein